MRLNDTLFNLVDLKRNLARAEHTQPVSRAALQRIAARGAFQPQRPRSKGFVGALLVHNARARRAAQPVANVSMDVRAPNGRVAVQFSFGPLT